MPKHPELPEEAVEACKPSSLSDEVLRRVLELGAPAIRKQFLDELAEDPLSIPDEILDALDSEADHA